MAKEERPLESTTRTFDTTKGRLIYTELSDLIAPKLLRLLDDIIDGKYLEQPFNECLIKDFHYQIIGDVMPANGVPCRCKLATGSRQSRMKYR